VFFGAGFWSAHFLTEKQLCFKKLRHTKKAVVHCTTALPFVLN